MASRASERLGDRTARPRPAGPPDPRAVNDGPAYVAHRARNRIRESASAAKRCASAWRETRHSKPLPVQLRSPPTPNSAIHRHRTRRTPPLRLSIATPARRPVIWTMRGYGGRFNRHRTADADARGVLCAGEVGRARCRALAPRRRVFMSFDRYTCVPGRRARATSCGLQESLKENTLVRRCRVVLSGPVPASRVNHFT